MPLVKVTGLIELVLEPTPAPKPLTQCHQSQTLVDSGIKVALSSWAGFTRAQLGKSLSLSDHDWWLFP